MRFVATVVLASVTFALCANAVPAPVIRERSEIVSRDETNFPRDGSYTSSKCAFSLCFLHY